MYGTQTQRQGAAPMGQLSIANSRISGDRIVVTLTASKPGGERVSIHRVFDHNGVEIDNSGAPTGGPGLTFAAAQGQQPQFDVAGYTLAIKEQREGDAVKIAETFRKAVSSYGANGGTTEAERIASAVYSYLEQNHGVSNQDGNNLVLKRDSVVAKAPTRSNAQEPGAWLLQLAPTWGV